MLSCCSHQPRYDYKFDMVLGWAPALLVIYVLDTALAAQRVESCQPASL